MCTLIPPDPNKNSTQISNSQAGKNNPYSDDYLVLFVIALIALFLVFAYAYTCNTKPSHPKFQIKSARVSNFKASLSRSASKSETQRAQFTANWETDFLVINPNDGLTLSFSPTIASVLYKKEFLKSEAISPFTTNQSDVTTMQVKFSGSGVDRPSDRNVLDIVEDWQQGTVRFNLRLMTMFYYGNDHKGHALIVSCNDVMFGFTTDYSGATSIDELIECEVQVK